MISPDELDRRFNYHPATPERGLVHERLREGARRYAELICDLVPPGREQSLAITALEETLFWANAGVARHPDDV